MRDLSGVNVVVTGVIGGESRRTAETKLRDAGANVQTGVGRSTDLLVTGGKVGRTKVDAAAKNGVEVVPWDELASEPDDDPRYVAAPDEVVMEAILGPAQPARQVGPMLCKAGDLPVGPDWIYEVKWDGLRCIATVRDGGVTMMSRSGKTDYVDQFPQIAQLLAGWPDVVLDGELVVLDANGDSSLSRIANKAGGSFVVFDVVELLGEQLRRESLSYRRAVLETRLADVFAKKGGGRIAVSLAFDDGEGLLKLVSERGLEGVVAKRKSSRYLEGSKGGDWIKVKLRNRQEFVVLGWNPGKGALTGRVGGLLLGVREDGRWVYVGRAGSGPDDAGRDDLLERLTPLAREQRHPDFDGRGASRAELRDVNWVEPELVVEVAFQRWTEDGRLLIPSLKGLRFDKEAIEVGRSA